MTGKIPGNPDSIGEEAIHGVRYWSRRGELNAPSAEYDSAALTLSYTGLVETLAISYVEKQRHHTMRKKSDQAAMNP